MNPTISIIVTLYNAATTLDRCLESILTQSLREIEVLCVNDGSTDGSQAILEQWSRRDSRVRIRQLEENMGILPATNLALRESTGEYIMFVDADDRLLPGACENAVRLIRKHGVDVLQFGVRVKAVLPGLDVTSRQKDFSQKECASEGLNILYDCFSMYRFRTYIWNKIYRGEVCRTACAAMPDLPISLPADMLQTFFFLYYAKTFRSVPDGPYYEYSIGNGISTSSPTAKQFAARCRASVILSAIEDFLKRENELENNRFLLETIRTHLMTGVVNELLALPEITKENIELAAEHWGSEVLYEFIKETGLLDVRCRSRHKLVPALVDQIQNQQKEAPPSAGGITLSVGGEKK